MSASQLIQQYVNPDFLTSNEWKICMEELEDLSRHLGKLSLIEFLDYLMENRLIIGDSEIQEIQDTHSIKVKQAIVECIRNDFFGEAPYDIVSDAIQLSFDITEKQFGELVNQLIEDNTICVLDSELKVN